MTYAVANERCSSSVEPNQETSFKKKWPQMAVGLLAVIGIFAAVATSNKDSTNLEEPLLKEELYGLANVTLFSTPSSSSTDEEVGLPVSNQQQQQQTKNKARALTSTVSLSITLPETNQFGGGTGTVTAGAEQAAAAAATATASGRNVFDFGNGVTSMLDVYQCGSEDGSPVELPSGGGRIAIQRSASQNVCLLQQVGDNGRTLARSYDFGEWESRVETQDGVFLNAITCQADACVLDLPATTSSDSSDDGQHPQRYQLVTHNDDTSESISRQDPNLQRQQEVSRFLIQATFGPRRHDIENFPDTYEEWLHHQIYVLPVSGHRQFWRQRLNKEREGHPRVEKACDKDTRWSRFLLGPQDRNRRIWRQQEGNYIVIRIDGEVRSRFDMNGSNKWLQRQYADINGWNICAVVGHGRQIRLDRDRCGNGQTGRRILQNTRIEFPPDAPPESHTIATFSDTCQWNPIDAIPHLSALLFGGINDNCQCTLPSNLEAKVVHRQRPNGGAWYRFDDFNIKKENDLQSPYPENSCVSAPVSPLNRQYCIVVPGVCTRRDGNIFINSQYSLSCGSPGEVASVPARGAVFSDGLNAKAYDFDVSTMRSGGQGHAKTIWLDRAVYAEDQLRQRVAFFLSGLWVGDLSGKIRQEAGMIYYDIFVRHAFNNYIDIMREVTYSQIMGGYLTYKGSTSFGYSGSHADENYARELMQLFTIGINKLHMNGTIVMDPSTGEPVETYDQDDVETMARVWTGFQKAEDRPESNGRYSQLLDPMYITAERHDQLPKMDLQGGYIGDGYPLCYDLPAQDFLHKGATYEFFTPDRELHKEAIEQRVQLTEGTPLYEALCNRGNNNPSDASCNFQSTLTLSANLGCNGVCQHQTLDLVKVGGATYKYVARPCVTFPFFNVGEEATIALNRRLNRGFCLDPTWKSSCCGSKMREVEWSGVSCVPELNIFADGKVSIHHDVPSPRSQDFAPGNFNFFRVAWDETSRDNLPTPGNCGPCQEHTREGVASCICSVQEVREPVFTSAAPPTSRHEALAKLHVGSVPPDEYNSGEYVLHSVLQGGITVFTKASGTPYDIDTIFAVDMSVGDGETKHFRNVKSYVNIVGAVPDVRFRNSPMFNNIMREANQDAMGAYNEVEAVLQHLLMHSNTAPFVSYRYITRFVTSNPSGGYVERVSQAFQTGRYGNFGTGRWGDLSATIAAVLLDNEARSVVLDVDPTQGQLREPLVKAVHVLRTMEFYRRIGYQRFLSLPGGFHNLFGQYPYEPPSVFSFFLPGFVRGNSVIDKQGLVSPETQLLDYSRIFGLLNYMPKRFNSWESDFITNSTEGDLMGVINDMNTLLTAGRMSDDKLELINDIVLETPHSGKTLSWKEKIYRVVNSFFLSTEFQSTNVNKPIPTPIPAPRKLEMPSPAQGFKAIIFVDLSGGADSMNMLVPHSECEGEDLYQAYRRGRRGVALPKSQLRVIDVPEGQQQCKKFGMPLELENLHQLYQDKDLMWIANVGSMKVQYPHPNKSEGRPGALNSHPGMFKHLNKGWVGARNSTGVLGRLADVLADSHYKVRSFGTGGWGAVLASSYERSPPPDIVRGDRATNLEGYYRDSLAVQEAGSSVFGQYYSHQIQQGLANVAQINSALNAASLDPNLFKGSGDLVKKFKTVAKLVQSHQEVDMDRGLFAVKMGGFDTHGKQAERLPKLLVWLDEAVGEFVTEMKRQGHWDDVVLVMRSEFGRTHKDNSNDGTDHGWNGNYWITGGAVRGGQVLGEYPEMRNRIPKNSWETIYHGLFEWMGVLPHQMSEALPLHHLFDNLFSADDLMES